MTSTKPGRHPELHSQQGQAHPKTVLRTGHECIRLVSPNRGSGDPSDGLPLLRLALCRKPAPQSYTLWLRSIPGAPSGTPHRHAYATAPSSQTPTSSALSNHSFHLPGPAGLGWGSSGNSTMSGFSSSCPGCTRRGAGSPGSPGPRSRAASRGRNRETTSCCAARSASACACRAPASCMA